jgi:hypothetical protein
MTAPTGMAIDSAKRSNCRFEPDFAGRTAVSAVSAVIECGTPYRKDLILSLSKDEVRATPSWFDKLTMRATGKAVAGGTPTTMHQT